MRDDIGAFVPGPRVRIEGQPGGPLAGLTFAAKDLFDVAGVPTGGGNHDWPTGRPIPTQHSWAVQTLLDAGATLIGKTITDEVSLGILGENAFDGTPINVRAPGRVPGGSSSGSAAAVAAGLCDTALGTDTGGSVRVPASFCGLYGIRPTHGRIDIAGMLPQAPTSDTTGWFARDAATFAKVSAVMLGEQIPQALPTCLVIAVDTFGFADANVAAALQPMVKRLAALIGHGREDIMAPQGLSVWARAQRTLQPIEAWNTFKPWLDERNPRFAFSVARQLRHGLDDPRSEQSWAALMRQEARGRMAHLLPDGHHPLPADHAVPRAAASASRCRCSIRCAIASPVSVRRADWPAIRRSAFRAPRLTASRSVCPSSARGAATRALVAVARALEGAKRDGSDTEHSRSRRRGERRCSSATSRR